MSAAAQDATKKAIEAGHLSPEAVKVQQRFEAAVAKIQELHAAPWLSELELGDRRDDEASTPGPRGRVGMESSPRRPCIEGSFGAWFVGKGVYRCQYGSLSPTPTPGRKRALTTK